MSSTQSAVRLPRSAPLFRVWLTTWPGRVVLVGLAAKIVAWGLPWAGLGSAVANVIDPVGSVALVAALAVVLYRLAVLGKRRLLWRVRRKLMLSYVFIGVIPALLIVAFFLLCGLILFFNVSSYLVTSHLQDVEDQARFVALSAAVEIQRAGVDRIEAILSRRRQILAPRYPGISLAAVPSSGQTCAGAVSPPREREAAATNRLQSVAVGSWPHVAPPRELPAWVGCSGFSGILAFPRTIPDAGSPVRAGTGAAGDDGSGSELAARAVGLPDSTSPTFAVVVDVPIQADVRHSIRQRTGVGMGHVVAENDDAPSSGGRLAAVPLGGTAAKSSGGGIEWTTRFDLTDWASGGTTSKRLQITVRLGEMYDRLSSTSLRSGGRNIGQVLAVAVLIVGGLFLIIEFVALVMGLTLAKSITGSVHELFIGTERVRRGDFTHKIPITADDQLGELADSFNSMTRSIEDLLREAEEKKRLEEELRIAREIQTSLLPRGQFQMPGVTITAHCEPAREVGGDYYDFFRLDRHRLGLLIADVSGKGTSAAFYMAELKGLMLSLTRIHRSPRQLLVEANRIISEHLDNRSFITLIYAVLDLQARTLTYCRAGHTPLIHRAAAPSDLDRTRLLAPEGLVLGLKLDGGEKFGELLEEASLPLGAGDILVLFTDGISEAMNANSDCFGEGRLCSIVEEHGHLPFDELRERVLREIDAFVGGAPQHDDMTMILVRIEDMAQMASAISQTNDRVVI